MDSPALHPALLRHSGFATSYACPGGQALSLGFGSENGQSGQSPGQQLTGRLPGALLYEGSRAGHFSVFVLVSTCARCQMCFCRLIIIRHLISGSQCTSWERYWLLGELVEPARRLHSPHLASSSLTSRVPPLTSATAFSRSPCGSLRTGLCPVSPSLFRTLQPGWTLVVSYFLEI